MKLSLALADAAVAAVALGGCAATDFEKPGGTAEQFAKFLAAERTKFADLIKKQGIKVN